MNRIKLIRAIKPGIAAALLVFLGMTANVAQAATINKTVCVRGVMLFGVQFWGFNDCAASAGPLFPIFFDCGSARRLFLFGPAARFASLGLLGADDLNQVAVRIPDYGQKHSFGQPLG